MNEEKQQNTPPTNNNPEATLQSVMKGILPREVKKDVDIKKVEVGKIEFKEIKPEVESPIKNEIKPVNLITQEPKKQPIVESTPIQIPKIDSSAKPINAGPVILNADGTLTEQVLNPNFLQKPIRTYQSDLAAALAKEAKSKGVNIPAKNSPKVVPSKGTVPILEKKPDIDMVRQGPGISFVKPIESFGTMTPNNESKPINPPPVTIPPRMEAQFVPKKNDDTTKDTGRDIYVAAPINPVPNVEKPTEPVPPPTPAPVIPPAPVITEKPKPVEIPHFAPIKIVPNVEKVLNVDKQPTIRTFETDLAINIAEKKSSAASIAIAENKRRDELKKMEALRNNQVATGSPIIRSEEIYKKPGGYYVKRIALSIISVLLIGGGLTGGYYLYLKSPLAVPNPIALPITIKNIIPSDKQMQASIDGLKGDQLISQIYSQFNKNLLSPGKIFELILQEKQNGIDTRISGSDFIDKANIKVPGILLRSITDKWFLGEYTEENGVTTPILALTTDFFQNSFAGMLAWEKTMPDDLASVLNYRNKAGDTSSYLGIQGHFIDRQIHSRDVREFINFRGELLFLYSFVDKETLLMTTSESAFIATLDRIEKQIYVR